jgi:hypothetical protein
MEHKKFVEGRLPNDKVRWKGGGTKPAGEYTFFYGKGNENHQLHTNLCISESHEQLRGLSW